MMQVHASCEKAYLEDFSDKSSFLQLNPITYSFVGTFMAGSVANSLNLSTGGAAAVFTTVGASPFATSKYLEDRQLKQQYYLIYEMKQGAGPLVDKFIQDVDPLADRKVIIEKFNFFNNNRAFCEPYLNTYEDMVEFIRSEL